MGTLWRLWKKGFFLEVIVTIASLLLTFLGVGVLVLSNVIKDTSSITLIGFCKPLTIPYSPKQE